MYIQNHNNNKKNNIFFFTVYKNEWKEHEF